MGGVGGCGVRLLTVVADQAGAGGDGERGGAWCEGVLGVERVDLCAWGGDALPVRDADGHWWVGELAAAVADWVE